MNGESVNPAETSDKVENPETPSAPDEALDSSPVTEPVSDAEAASSSQPAPEEVAAETTASEADTGGEETAPVEQTPSADESSVTDDEPVVASTETTPKTPGAPMPAVDEPDVEASMDWYILKVAFNREDSIADTLRKRVKMEGMAEFFGDIVVPTEDVATFTRDGKRRISKRKLLPGYIMVNMIINDDTWFLVRETNGISDFTGAAGKPMPMEQSDIDRFINKPEEDDEDEPAPVKIGIPFKVGDRVRVKEGNFENQEGEVDTVDEANGRVTVIINIFGRSVPMELDHWQVEPL